MRKVKQSGSQLFNDIRESLLEARDYASGKKTGVIVHHIIPNETDARAARLLLGLSEDEHATLLTSRTP